MHSNERSILEVLKEARQLGIRCSARTFWNYYQEGLLPKGRKLPGRGNVMYFPANTVLFLYATHLAKALDSETDPLTYLTAGKPTWSDLLFGAEWSHESKKSGNTADSESLLRWLRDEDGQDTTQTIARLSGSKVKRSSVKRPLDALVAALQSVTPLPPIREFTGRAAPRFQRLLLQALITVIADSVPASPNSMGEQGADRESV